MPYPYCIVTMPTTYALLWLHCCHAYNLSYALPLLQSYHAYNLCPTLTSLLPCLQPMPYPYCIVVMPTTCPMPYPYCIVTMPTTYDLPFVHCYHAYNLWLSLFALPTTCDLPFALHIHPWEGHILHCLSCVIFITRVTKAVVSIHKSPGISMCDRKGCYKYLSVNKRGELKSFNTNINSYGNQFKINYPSLDYFHKPLKTYIKWSSSLQVHYLFL